MGNEWVAFVSARLAEEEAEANTELESLARFENRPGDWTRLMYDRLVGPFDGSTPVRNIGRGMYVGKLTDPRRVLSEIAATRELLASYKRATDPAAEPFAEILFSELMVSTLGRLIAMKAAAWLNHPDYPGREPQNSEV